MNTTAAQSPAECTCVWGPYDEAHDEQCPRELQLRAIEKARDEAPVAALRTI